LFQYDPSDLADPKATRPTGKKILENKIEKKIIKSTTKENILTNFLLNLNLKLNHVRVVLI
jgi:hypothetical protein